MPNYFEDQVLDLYYHILEKGEERVDRTGVGTKAIFGGALNIDLRDGFPLMTTKAIPWNAVLSELLWFIEGSQDERRLAELRHGTRDATKKTIWSPNAEADYWKPKAQFEGDMGRIYGVQWRRWRTVKMFHYDGSQLHPETNTTTYYDAKVQITETDQLADLIKGLKEKPTDRRHILTAWNPGELDQMALPPCHMFAQFYVSNEGHLDCQMYQRSVDSFLGLPFNIASYAMLTHLIAHCTGLKPRILNMILGDTHIYTNHIDQVREQLKREKMDLPQVHINPAVTDIFKIGMDDVQLRGYNSHGAIKAVMAV